jgi:hypothetical protein
VHIAPSCFLNFPGHDFLIKQLLNEAEFEERPSTTTSTIASPPPTTTTTASPPPATAHSSNFSPARLVVLNTVTI